MGKRLKLYNMDCLKGMQKMVDLGVKVDMILCDLPYGTTQNKWDTIISLDKLWILYKQLIKDNGVIVLTAQPPFDKVLGVSNIKWLKYEWIWQKEAGTGFLNAKKMPLKDHENILIFYKKSPIYNPQKQKGKPYVCKKGGGTTNYNKDSKNEIITVNNGLRYPKTVLHFSRDKTKLHPTQKPVALIEYLIKTYTNKNDLVLDNCFGSGTTAIACINTKRKFVGFELDKKYFRLARKRIKNHLLDLGLI